MTTKFKRSDRVADSLVKEVSQMIVKGEIKDPRLSSVYITGIKVVDNLSLAEIFFTVLEDSGDKDQALKGLESAKGFIKSTLSKRLKIRRIPDLRFSYDSALEKGYKVDEILREIGSEK